MIPNTELLNSFTFFIKSDLIIFYLVFEVFKLIKRILSILNLFVLLKVAEVSLRSYITIL